jgi:hypothetical protein
MSSHRPRTGDCPCSLELVWDNDLNATAFTADGGTVPVGPDANLSPATLLALAASSCLMTTLLELAAGAGISIAAYLSSARVRQLPDGTSELALAPCVVVTSEPDGTRMERLWEHAILRSPTLRLFGARLQVEPVVRIIPPA